MKREFKYRKYTDQQINQVKALYPNHYSKDIALMMNMPVSYVYQVANKYQIHKSAEFNRMELQKQGERLKKDGAKHRFIKGGIPFNKGKKMSETAYEICKKTMFKKGSVPCNVKPIGYQRLDKDGYLKIKIADKTFVLYHRYVWEQANGPIPDDHIVIFKDGNKMNFDINNLELITMRENMMRNTIQNYPEEIIGIIKLNSKLKKTIKNKSKQ